MFGPRKGGISGSTYQCSKYYDLLNHIYHIGTLNFRFMPPILYNKVICTMSSLWGLDLASSSIEVVEELVEKELAAHNKPSIQVSKILHSYTPVSLASCQVCRVAPKNVFFFWLTIEQLLTEQLWRFKVAAMGTSFQQETWFPYKKG